MAAIVDLRWQPAPTCGKMVKRRQVADEPVRGLAEGKGMKEEQVIFASSVCGQRQVGGLGFGNAQYRIRD